MYFFVLFFVGFLQSSSFLEVYYAFSLLSIGILLYISFYLLRTLLSRSTPHYGTEDSARTGARTFCSPSTAGSGIH